MARLLRNLSFAAAILLAASPAHASPITVAIGDKDGFGLGLGAGDLLPCFPSDAPLCISPVHDWRSAAEAAALTGAQLTDLYSALYDGTESDCPLTGCSPNGATGWVYFPFAGTLTTASITMLMADFESEQNKPMLAAINGIPISFYFEHGYRVIAEGTLTLTPEMVAAANAVGEVRLFLDHHSTFDPQTGVGTGSFDYIAFDYFELNSPAVPEPGTWLLIGTGLAWVVARRRARRPRSS